ncbi:MAG TPA: type IV toxin-antitoxin system AbiEi family antitoxin domain-containing protein [Trebonia sp.]
MLLDVQAGIADREQALTAGFSRRQISYRLHSGNWQRVYPGVYATFTGPLSREARLWAAVRCGGDEAMVSHETAAEVHGIIDQPPGNGIHVMVPLRRRPARATPVRGIIFHRSGQSQSQLLGPFKLPRTRVADTVLDLVAASSTFDQGYGWIARAVSRRIVTVGQLRTALAERGRIRWRAWLNDALEDVHDGIHSALERRYLADVERAHGLPRSQHQVRRQFGNRAHYRDNWYPGYRVVVEIDGPSYHQNERVEQDNDRDNVNLATEDVKTFRFGPAQVTEHACRTATMVAVTLRRNGWPGTPRRCRRPGCAAGLPTTRPGP